MNDHDDKTKKRQVGGDHYLGMGLQPWDAFENWYTMEQFSGFLIMSAQAYLCRFNVRAPGKGGLQDVQKAIHTLQKLEEILKKEDS